MNALYEDLSNYISQQFINALQIIIHLNNCNSFLIFSKHTFTLLFILKTMLILRSVKIDIQIYNQLKWIQTINLQEEDS